MSRSRKKVPITGCAGNKSDKYDKTIAHRKFRRKSKQRILHGSIILPEYMREISEIYSFPKDGKCYWSPEWRTWKAYRK